MNILTNPLKSAFDEIQAEESLKAKTKKFLEKEIQKRNTKKNRIPFRRYSVMFASIILLFFVSFFSYHLYFTPSAYIDLDVNPSIEIVLNRFERVIDSYAYNLEGRTILQKANIQYKDYKKAIGILVDTMVQDGYAQKDSFFSITLQSENEKKENQILSGIESTVRKHHDTAQLECFSISGYVVDMAHQFNLSPAKYLAIQELIEVEPTITIESCRNHSIVELKELTKKHANRHSEETTNPSNSSGNRHHHH